MHIGKQDTYHIQVGRFGAPKKLYKTLFHTVPNHSQPSGYFQHRITITTKMIQIHVWSCPWLPKTVGFPL